MIDFENYKAGLDKEIRRKKICIIVSNILSALMISTVVVLAMLWDYVGTTIFTVFCVAAAVFLLCKYVVYPQMWRMVDYFRPSKDVTADYHTFISALGCGNVLFGRFHDSPSWPDISYSFFALFYIPLIPTGCYSIARSGKGVFEVDAEQYYSRRVEWKFVEVLYIYVKCWSAATMVLTVMIAFFDYVESLCHY